MIAVTDNVGRSELVRKCGAFETLTFHPKMRKDILKSTEGLGAAIIYDAVGEDLFKPIGEWLKNRFKNPLEL